MAQVGLSKREQDYLAAARAPNTRRGYATDLREFTWWCTQEHQTVCPAAPGTISAYLTVLADAGASVGTIARRLSSILTVNQNGNGPG